VSSRQITTFVICLYFCQLQTVCTRVSQLQSAVARVTTHFSAVFIERQYGGVTSEAVDQSERITGRCEQFTHTLIVRTHTYLRIFS